MFVVFSILTFKEDKTVRFSYRAILSTFILSLGLAVISPHVLVLAQTSESSQTSEETNRKPPSNQTPESNQAPRRYRTPGSSTTPRPSINSGSSSSNQTRANDIQAQVFNNKQIKDYCQNIDADIEFELDGDQLQIITGNHQCSYKIVQEVLEPQLKQGKIKTYEFSGGQEDLIVSF